MSGVGSATGGGSGTGAGDSGGIVWMIIAAFRSDWSADGDAVNGMLCSAPGGPSDKKYGVFL